VIAAPYPVYFGGYYPNPYYGGYATAPAPADSGPAPAYYDSDPANAQGYPAPGNPTVIVNPYYTPETSNPVLRDYSYMTPPVVAPPDQSSPDQPAAPSVIFLIAMKSHTIYPAIAYWVQDDTLNYITPQGVRNQVSLDMVDRAFSTQLNKERNIDFGLPAAK
jgi:hypothetical protein